jgi:hypothetical protein
MECALECYLLLRFLSGKVLGVKYTYVTSSSLDVILKYLSRILKVLFMFFLQYRGSWVNLISISPVQS